MLKANVMRIVMFRMIMAITCYRRLVLDPPTAEKRTHLPVFE